MKFVLLADADDDLRRSIYTSVLDGNEALVPYYNLPKGLLPINSKCCLDYLYDLTQQFSQNGLTTNRRSSRDVTLITDATNFKHYERFCINKEVDLINTGSTDPRHSPLQSLNRVVLTEKDERVTLFSTDFLHDHHAFQQLDLFTGGNTVFINSPDLVVNTSGNNTIESFNQTSGPHTQIVLSLTRDAFKVSVEYTNMRNGMPDDTLDDYIDLLNYLVTSGVELNLVTLPADDIISRWYKVRTPQEYLSFQHSHISLHPKHRPMSGGSSHLTPIEQRVYARVGLMGNPSDGFFGKTISLTITNFWASVTLVPQKAGIRFVHNPILDPLAFASISSIDSVVVKDGYHGACVLFLAAAKVFSQYLKREQIEIHGGGFRLAYDTNIPRQVGLAGSSALIIAFLKAIIKYYDVEMSYEKIASLALEAEECELGISAGHQDRVVQTFAGCMYMDFNRDLMTTRGYGVYNRIQPTDALKNLWMAFVAAPKNSGKVHSNVRARFEEGDTVVINAMNKFADITDAALDALNSNDSAAVAKLMNSNFECRRALYGDAVIGEASLKMIEIGKRNGFAVKFSGSGGCVIGLWKGGENEDYCLKQVKRDLEDAGFVFCMINQHVPE